MQLFFFFFFSYIETDEIEHYNKDLQQIMYDDNDDDDGDDDDDDDVVIAQSVLLTSFFELFYMNWKIMWLYPWETSININILNCF